MMRIKALSLLVILTGCAGESSPTQTRHATADASRIELRKEYQKAALAYESEKTLYDDIAGQVAALKQSRQEGIELIDKLPADAISKRADLHDRVNEVDEAIEKLKPELEAQAKLLEVAEVERAAAIAKLGEEE